jgi:hypothetical protein
MHTTSYLISSLQTLYTCDHACRRCDRLYTNYSCMLPIYTHTAYTLANAIAHVHNKALMRLHHFRHGRLTCCTLPATTITIFQHGGLTCCTLPATTIIIFRHGRLTCCTLPATTITIFRHGRLTCCTLPATTISATQHKHCCHRCQCGHERRRLGRFVLHLRM